MFNILMCFRFMPWFYQYLYGFVLVTYTFYK